MTTGVSIFNRNIPLLHISLAGSNNIHLSVVFI